MMRRAEEVHIIRTAFALIVALGMASKPLVAQTVRADTSASGAGRGVADSAAIARELQSTMQARKPALAIEWLGGALGSAATLTAYNVTDSCEDEPLETVISCVFDTGYLWFYGSLAMSTLGAYTTGRIADTDPSAPGALLGSFLGGWAGAALTEQIRDNMTENSAVTILSYGITHGLFTAIGSRIGASLR